MKHPSRDAKLVHINGEIETAWSTRYMAMPLRGLERVITIYKAHKTDQEPIHTQSS